MKRTTANLPLHGGKAPAYLFKRMKKLAGAITMAIVDEYGPEEMLRRLSDPWWFQALGCVLGYDWHSSGLTTVTCGALREAGKIFGDDLGIVVAGGKGKTSRKTPREIAEACDRLAIPEGEKLIQASRLSAKVDSAAVQDGYQIYHHSFLLTASGAWCVIQQGMNDAAGDARRYHWLGRNVSDFVCEPHAAVENLSARPRQTPGQLPLLNMVAREAQGNRQASASLVRDDTELLLREIRSATEGPTLFAPRRHPVLKLDVNLPRLEKVLRQAGEAHPADFQALLGTPNVGPATIRSLSLIAELIHDAPASRRDPAERIGPDGNPMGSGRKWADYSYAHGGKDGTPFPVDRETYDRNIDVLLESVRKARLGQKDKSDALKRLSRVAPET